MRPEQQTIILENPHVISNFNANINFKHLNVVIMMRMTDVSYMQFYENVDMKMIRSIWSPWQKELGATAMKTETMPWQRPGSDNSLSDWCKQRCGGVEHEKDGGVIPDTGCPMSRRRCQMREQLMFMGGLQQPTCIRSTDHRLGGYTFWGVRYRSGSGRAV